MFVSFVTFIIFGLALMTLTGSIKIVRPYEKGLVVRLGRYQTTVDSGLTLLIPFLDHLTRVDMREQVMNVLPQSVITKDNVVVTVDAVIYYKIVDPVKAVFEIENFNLAATTLAQTNLRNLIGDKQLDETLTARDIINTSLREVLDEATNPWGVKVTKVELQKIEPPQDITDAMSKQMKAEREKRAAILEAEGDRQAEITRAEGESQATETRASGRAKAIKLEAEAQAKAIELVAKSAEAHFTSKAEKLKKLEVARDVLMGSGTKFILPTNSEVINVLNLDGEQQITPIRPKK